MEQRAGARYEGCTARVMRVRWCLSVVFLWACGGSGGGASSPAGTTPTAPSPGEDAGGTDAGVEGGVLLPDSGAAAPDGSTPASPCSTDSATFDKLVGAVKADLTSAGITGGALAIVCGGKIFSAGIGQTAKSGGQPVGPHTRFNVGSTQKAFTAALAMRMVEQGKISLDDSASKWVPGVNSQAPYARSFTLSELLSHVSGYPAVPPSSATAIDLAAFFQQVAQQQLWSPPGAVFNYNNVGFDFAGLAMQNAASQPFGALVESEVFGPAGMVDARMDASKVLSEGNYATGYLSDGSGGSGGPADLVGVTVEGPDTGAWASVEDLAHFAETLLSGGGTMLQPASVAKMTTARTGTDDTAQQYGYGMFVVDLGGTAMWTHPGENDGYSCDLTMVPSRGFASALLVSTDAGVASSAYYGAVQAITGSPLPPPPDDSFQNADMPEHVGSYKSNDTSIGTITVTQSGTTMQIAVGGMTQPMTPAWKDTYMFTYAPWGGDIEVNFWRVSGKVAYVVTRAFVGAKM